MSSEELLSFCKILLRQKNTTAFDDEILSLIEACFADLKLSGVRDFENELIKRAVGLYVKAHFGFDNPDRDGLITCYESLKLHLSISKMYGEVLSNEA